MIFARFIDKNFTLFLLITFLIFFSCKSRELSGNSEGQEMPKVIKEIGIKSASLASQRSIRLAITAFLPTQREFKAENDFGKYFAEALISGLKADQKRLKIFERTRLDVLLKENQLSLSGLIGRDQAKKIGELAPIDYILTGTYTKLTDIIEVNGRIIDAVSGEIIITFSRKVSLSSQIANLFDQRDISKDAHAANGGQKKCDKDLSLISNLLNDFTSARKVQKLADNAVKIPFDNNCGKIHLDIIVQFKKHKIYNIAYTGFLNKTLYEIKKPSDDLRASYILSYFYSEGWIEDDQWKAGMEIVRKSDERFMPGYACFLFRSHGLSEEKLARQRKRIDQFFQLAKGNRLGMPVNINFDQAFYIMISSLHNYLTPRDVASIFHIYEKYSDELSAPNTRGIYQILKGIYDSDIDRQKNAIILNWIIKNFNQGQASISLAEDMIEFIKYLKYNIKNKKRALAEEGKNVKDELLRYQGHFEIFKRQCSPQIAKSMPLTKFDWEIKKRSIFCLEMELDCPGLVPSVAELVKKLAHNSSKVKLEAMEYLLKMNENALPMEKELIKVIRKAERKIKVPDNQKIIKSTLEIFANINTQNKDAHEIILRLAIRGYQDAIKSIGKIGEPFVPLLIRELGTDDFYNKVSIVQILGSLESKAKPALSKLHSELKKTKNDRLRDEINQAINQIR
jgi:TolB-like protein